MSIKLNISKQFVDPNPYSRPEGYDPQGYKWIEARGIVYHWGAVPSYPGAKAATAQNYRDAHQQKADEWKAGKEDIQYGGYPFFVDDEQIIQVGEIEELYYHVGAGRYTPLALERFTPVPKPTEIGPWPCCYLIGICLAHPTTTGKFPLRTIQNAAELGAYLCLKYRLTTHDIFRHHDITGKRCPRWWVDRPDDWVDFQDRIKGLLIKHQEWEEYHIPR